MNRAHPLGYFAISINIASSKLDVALEYYHFVKEHFGLRQKSNGSVKKWIQRTESIAAGITDHIGALDNCLQSSITIFKKRGTQKNPSLHAQNAGDRD